MYLNESGLRGDHDRQLRFWVFRRDLNLWDFVSGGSRVEDGVARFFIVSVDRIPSPPREFLKPIFTRIVSFGVREHCPEGSIQRRRSQTHPFSWLSVVI